MRRFLSAALFALISLSALADRHVDYVNPFIGTAPTDGLLGNTFPGPTLPFGFVQLSPDTRDAPNWDCASGYHYNDKRIIGFSHTRLSGTGASDFIDLLLMPNAFDPDRSKADHGNWLPSAFSHDTETARPGYYSVLLDDHKVFAELAATTRCGIHRYTYKGEGQQSLLVDLDHSAQKGDWNRRVIQAQLRIVSPTVIEGHRLITGWAKLRKVYFHMELSRPLDLSRISRTTINGDFIRENLPLAPSAEPLVVKVALSPVSQQSARRNMEVEAASWNFDNYAQAAADVWEKALSVIDIEGSDEVKRCFYTALYHSLTQPNVISDVDGRYIATDYTEQTLPQPLPTGRGENSTSSERLSIDKVTAPLHHREGQGVGLYSTFSIWDTYRAIHPLYNIICPDRNAAFIQSMLTHYDTYGYLPIWDIWGQDNYCMIGNHAIPIIVDAVMKGLPGIDPERAYEACRTSSLLSHMNSPFEVWEEYGFMPEDRQSQSVSITLEMAFDDWCVARLARHLGKADDAARFERRAGYFRNLWNAEHRFFWGRNADGSWLAPFDPLRYGANGGNPFTEGNAWQWRWYVPHDIPALIDLFGGPKAMERELDTFFSLMPGDEEKNSNASGFVGQYIQGNEPDHHAPYLYNDCGHPEKAQAMLHHIMTTLYNDTPSGLSGNDDCGEMSAWYIFSALGFYPVNPCSDEYSIGTPLVDHAVIHLSSLQSGGARGAGDFTIDVKRRAPGQHLIKSVRLNGRPLESYTLPYEALKEGGTLEFIMK